MRRFALAFVLALGFAAPVSAQLTAPNARATVQAVMAAHPEINTCDENQRGAIVDYAAQRLNKAAGAVVWGRKSRTAQPTDLNSDGLTFKRADGQFEIYDAISGVPPCGATWDGFGPFAQGGNGFWVPPQLGPEPGSGPPPPPPAGFVTKAEMDAALAEMRASLWDQVVQTIGAESKNAIFRIGLLEKSSHDGINDARVKQLIAEAFANVMVYGSTGRTLRHNHSINVTLKLR